MGTITTLIPARAGSKRVPHKNVRLVSGKPLVAHAIEAGLGRIVVDTDDPQVRSIAQAYGADVVERDPALTGDNTTIDDLVATYLPADDVLLVLQPTVLHRNLPKVVEDFIVAFIEKDGKAWTMATPIPHLVWTPTSPPLQRINSQALPNEFLKEIGCRAYAKDVTDPTPQDAFAIDRLFDIDTHEDLAAVKIHMEEGRVFFRVRADDTVGSGHLFRCLTLAAELDHHSVAFELVGNAPPWAKDRIEPWPVVSLPHDLTGAVVVNDTLDTTEIEIAELKARGAAVVSLEDLGQGARLADVVINALYPSGNPHERTGPRWAVIRPEFIIPTCMTGKRQRVLVTFGGTDPSHLTEQAAAELAEIPAEVRIISPPARDVCITGLLDNPAMAAEMAQADLIVTSGGRTVYEAAALGKPVITILQNPREATHSHLGSVVNLGLGALLPMGKIRATVMAILADTELMYGLIDSVRVDGLGAQRIAAEVEALL